MKALIKKDLGWLSFFFLIGTAIPFFILLDKGFNNVWVLPQLGNYGLILEFFVAWSLSGLAFGIFAAVREELTKTEDYLRHRSVGPGRIFAARTIACSVVLLAWIIVPFAIQALFIRGRWAENASLAEWGRFWYYLGVGLVAFSSFAMGYFAGTLRLNWIKRVLIGLAGTTALVATSWAVAWLFGKEGVSSFSAYVIAHLAITVFLFMAAYRNFLPGYDPDRPVPWKTFKLSGTAVVFFSIVSAWVCLSWLQSEIHSAFAQGCPSIWQTGSGEVKLVEWNSDEECYWEVDDRHHPDGVLEESDQNAAHLFSSGWWTAVDFYQTNFGFYPFHSPWTEVRRWYLGSEVVCFDGLWYWVGRHSHDRMVRSYFHYPEGMLYLYSFSSPYAQRTPSIKKIGKGPGNEPFSSRARPLSVTPFSSLMQVCDSEDGSLWSCDIGKGEKAFRRTPLPNDDLYRHATSIHHLADEVDEDGNPILPERIEEYTAVIGDRGVYLWNGESFEEAPENLRAHMMRQERRFNIIEKDPLALKIEVVDVEGKPFYTHQYGLYTIREKKYGAFLYIFSILRTPATELYSFLASGTEPQSAFLGPGLFDALVDPLLVPGKRAWLLLCNLGLALFLAVHSMRRLNRFGAPKSRVRYWGLAVLLGGVFVYLAYRAFETERAYRTSPVLAPEEAPPLLISDAGKAGELSEDHAMAT